MNRIQRLGMGFLIFSLSLVMGGTAVSAGGPSAHSGTYGRHYLADSEDGPDVLCRYNGDGNFYALNVESPFVYAADLTGGVDTQSVGWSFRVQKATEVAGTWTTIYTSTTQVATATDHRDAAFTRRSHVFTPAQVPTAKIYRVQILMSWYTHGAVSGTARHTVEWYHGGAFEPSFGPDGYCPGFQF